MLDHMREIGGVIGRAASTLQLKSENERASVISTADVQTDFLEDGAMHQVLTGHDFDLEDLKRQAPATVYLCLPAGRLATHGRWLRLMVALAMEAMEETGPLEGDALPVLFCLDEFAALGHMSTIEKAAGQIAGFGVKLWPILQDVTQLKRDYPASWETFIGNAGMVTAFGVSDISTTEYLSKMLGKTMIAAPNMSDGINTPYSLGGGGSKSSSTSIGYQIANLLDPHEVAACFRRESYLILCIPAGYQPFPLYRNLYYKQLIGYFDPAPGHEPPPTLAELQGERDREAATKKQVAAAKREEQEREDQWLRDEEERKRQAREKLDTSKYRLILVFGGWGRLARALAVPSVH
jgi:type IV secretion system protein VirD4